MVCDWARVRPRHERTEARRGFLRGVATLAGAACLPPPAMASVELARIPEIRVHTAVELVSAIFRVAGAKEYGNAPSRWPYVAALERTLEPQLDHPVFSTARRLRRVRGVRFDAPMRLAVRLTELPDLRWRAPIRPRPADLDRRWPTRGAERFVAQAQDLVQSAELGSLFAEWADYTRAVAARYSDVVRPTELGAWFHGYFAGAARETFTIVPSLLNFTSNYGPSFGREVYAILGISELDEDHLPVLGPMTVSLVAHEFAHSFVNPRVAGSASRWRATGRRLLARNLSVMRRFHYGSWRPVIYETVVRAVTRRYLVHHAPKESLEANAWADREQGFSWVEPVADHLARHYEPRRDRYPTFDAFIPELARALADIAR